MTLVRKCLYVARLCICTVEKYSWETGKSAASIMHDNLPWPSSINQCTHFLLLTLRPASSMVLAHRGIAEQRRRLTRPARRPATLEFIHAEPHDIDLFRISRLR